MVKKVLRSENDIKAIGKKWYDDLDAWSYAPIQTMMGVHGLADRIGCVAVAVTPAMVGKTIGLFVASEYKKPGRRGERRRGMTVAQEQHMNDINKRGGLSIVCDGPDDLAILNRRLYDLITVPL